MDITKISLQELDRQIELYNDRVETVKDAISEEEDSFTKKLNDWIA